MVAMHKQSMGLLICAVGALSACSEGPQPGPAAPEVSVIVAQPSSIDNVAEAPGRVQAIRLAQVRARVDGIIQRRLYSEGSDVAAGQKLFAIDPSELNADLNAAEAALLRAEATETNAASDVERYKGLIASGVISQQAYDAALATLRTAQADVAEERANVERARLNLGYATVTAPISGRARRAEVTEGALVSASSATLLTTIEQLDPIYVNFSQSSADLLALRREASSGALKLPELTKVAVQLVLEDGSVYAHTGHMNFLDLSIDEATGTAAMRAVFPNPDRTLLPGQFVRARINAGVRPNGILVPQRAVKLTPQGATVLIVGSDGLVASRNIKVGALRAGSWVVSEGLAAGDRVIVDGIQKVQPGAPATVVQAPAQNASTGAVSTSSGSK
jgi:membrane fusion protein (multidrug efflux system)